MFEKLLNYGHHNEFEESGITVEDIKSSIKNKIINYDHSLDKSEKNRNKSEYKLKKIDQNLLPDYLSLNKDKYSEWFD